MRTPSTALLLAFAAVSTAQTATSSLDLTKTPTVFLVGYSHLDTEWCWTYRHSILDCIPKTLTENFALFEKYPDYVFNWTGAKRYEFMKEYYPAEYARLKEYVRQGRWAVTGSGWDECDASIPAPESILRQVLYSNRFFKREFGVVSNNYLVPDVFGFPASMPTILAHAGLKGMSTCKLSYGAGAAVPIPFNVGRWVGPDGSSIVAALNCQSYHTRVKEDVSKSATILARIQDTQKKSGLLLDYTYYGLGDEGGSPEPESVAWVEQSKKSDGSIRVISRAADEMFDVLTPSQRSALPEYRGDLLLTQHSAGTATSGAIMKRWNQRNELLADAAERAAVTAQLSTGAKYPQARLTNIWERFLSGQMHDILPGTSIPQAYTFAWNDQLIALNQSSDVIREAVGNMAAKLNTNVQGTPVVIYNPLAIERTEVIELAMKGTAVCGPDGKHLPTQRVGSKLVFQAKLPSLGYAVFDVRQGNASVVSALKVSPSGLENERYRVRIDGNGDVAGIYDKLARREMLSAPARLAFTHHRPSRHPAWNMDWTDAQKPPSGYVDGPAQIEVVESGPVRVAVRIRREAQGSKFTQTIRLEKGGQKVEFDNAIDWRSEAVNLKATFPLTVANEKATYNWEYGTVQRGNNQEKFYEGPFHRWFDLTDRRGDYGVSVLSEGKYGSDKPDDQTLRLTLLYTPGIRDNYQHQATSDWGHHEIRYALVGHVGDWRQGDIQNQAERFVQPIMPFTVNRHTGAMKQTSLVTVSDRSVAVVAMKKAEESAETIVRLVERNGVKKTVTLTFDRPVLGVRAVNGQEQAVPDRDIKFKGRQITVPMAAYRPRALAVRFAVPTTKTSAVVIKLPFNADVTSTFTGKSDGAFSADGQTLPGELLPSTLTSGGIPFALGDAAKSAKNAVAAQGQTILIPSGRTLYLLAASAEGDRIATFTAGGQPHQVTIPAWDGFIGQWDTREWEGGPLNEDEKTFGWTRKLLGIKPGYTKQTPVAWYTDHRRTSKGVNDPYHFGYLFRIAIPLPKGATAVKLPNDPAIKIMAATVADGPVETVKPIQPLYDILIRR